MAGIVSRSLRSVGSGIRGGWLLLGITLILIVVCEVGLRLALTTRDRLMDPQPPIDRKTDGDGAGRGTSQRRMEARVFQGVR